MSNYKVLLADDEPQNIKNLFDALNPEIYRVFVAANGKAAVEQAIKHHPDAIIMDWDMPEMNGLEAIRLIRETEEIKEIPIIVATGKMTHVENLRTALEAGANDFIRKPFDAIEINARMQSMIRLRQEQQKTLALEKEILQQKLDNKEREIEKNRQTLAGFKVRLLHNNRYIDRIITDLYNISQETNEATRKSMQNLLSELKVDIHRGSWQEFESHFENLHTSFLANLRSRFPDLTQNEMELCMLFKLNMTTKEMESLTYKTSETLKKARQRLKKKLGLSINDSLYDFITQLG